MRRNKADIGRLILGVLIVACLIIMPLRQFALSERSTYENVIQAALDECTDRVGNTKRFTLRDYEELTQALYNTGTSYDIELEIGRYTEDLSDVALLPSEKILEYLLGPSVSDLDRAVRPEEVECDLVGADRSIRGVAAHIHTQDCYIGHNHQACGCTFNGREWSCGIDKNDAAPICDHVVVSADWNKNQTVESGHGAPISEGGQLDNTLRLTFLNGTTATVRAKVMAYDDASAGTKTVALVYNAYYDTAYNNTKTSRTFPVNVTVLKESHTCPLCGITYDGAEDGTDPGCPYCHHKILSLRSMPAAVYATADDPHAIDELKIIAQYADGTESEVAYESDFDYALAGLQTITATVKGDESVTYADRGVNKSVSIPDNEQTLAVEVRLTKMLTCPVCLNEYACALDGTDPGCPYCNDRVMDLRIVPVKTEYNEGEPLDLHVFAVYRNGETELADYAWYSDYDPWQQGEQMIHIFHDNLVKALAVTVIDPFLKVCPICGTAFDSRVDDSCPNCASTLVGLEVTAVPEVYSYGEDINLTVWAEYQSGEKVLLAGGYEVDGYNEYFTDAPQTVTVRYKDVTADVVVTVLPRAELPTNIVVCPNGHFYELNEDGTDPGCPYCAGAEGIEGKTGGEYYTDMIYTSQILASLQAYGYIELEKGDSFTIRVAPRNKTIAHIVSDFFVKTAIPRNTFVSGITIGK